MKFDVLDLEFPSGLLLGRYVTQWRLIQEPHIFTNWSHKHPSILFNVGNIYQSVYDFLSSTAWK